MEQQHPLNDLMSTAMEKIRTMVDANTIIGTPIQTGDVTLIPVSRLSFGIASGGSDFVTKNQKPEQENSFEQPEAVSPVESSVVLERESFSYAFPALSLTVFRIPMAEKEPESAEK